MASELQRATSKSQLSADAEQIQKISCSFTHEASEHREGPRREQQERQDEVDGSKQQTFLLLH